MCSLSIIIGCPDRHQRSAVGNPTPSALEMVPEFRAEDHATRSLELINLPFPQPPPRSEHRRTGGLVDHEPLAIPDADE